MDGVSRSMDLMSHHVDQGLRGLWHRVPSTAVNGSCWLPPDMISGIVGSMCVLRFLGSSVVHKNPGARTFCAHVLSGIVSHDWEHDVVEWHVGHW